MYDPRHPVRHELRDYFLARTFGYTLPPVFAENEEELLAMGGVYASMWNRQREADEAREILEQIGEEPTETPSRNPPNAGEIDPEPLQNVGDAPVKSSPSVPADAAE